jgi:hypothetical protein
VSGRIRTHTAVSGTSPDISEGSIVWMEFDVFSSCWIRLAKKSLFSKKYESILNEDIRLRFARKMRTHLGIYTLLGGKSVVETRIRQPLFTQSSLCGLSRGSPLFLSRQPKRNQTCEGNYFHYNLRRQLSPPKSTSVFGPEQSLL